MAEHMRDDHMKSPSILTASQRQRRCFRSCGVWRHIRPRCTRRRYQQRTRFRRGVN